MNHYYYFAKILKYTDYTNTPPINLISFMTISVLYANMTYRS